MENSVTVLDWPSHNPELNSVENLWSILSIKVYANFKQFDFSDDLKESLIYH